MTPIPPPRGVRPGPAAAAAIAVGAGALWGACFGSVPLPALAAVGLVPLLLLVGAGDPGAVRPGRRNLLLGWLHGTAAWMVALVWIAPTLETYGQLGRGLSIALLVVLGIYLGIFHALFAALGARLWRRGGWRAGLGLPALWVALEWAQTLGPFGFPWNLAAVAWIDVPGALPLSSWIGAYGVSALVIAVNVGVATSLRRRRFAPAAVAGGVVLVLLAWGGRWGAGAASAEAPGWPVRVIQPNTPNLVTWDAAEAEAGYQRLLRLSRDACDRPGALLIWPESAAWPRVFGADPQLNADLQALVAAGCPVLLNSVRTEGESYFNSAFLVTGEGPASYADKRHLVPFGEYVPGGSLFPFIGKLARNAGDFRAAEELRLIPWASELLGLSICYEIIFPAEVAASVAAGATVLVTITNDAWYGDTAAPWQHFRSARFRAAENRRPLLRAAITGVSGLIRADGRVVAQLGPGEEGILRGVVEGRSDRSPYSRAPLLPLGAAALLAAFAMLKP